MGYGAYSVPRTIAILWGRRVALNLGVGVETILVVVESGVLDYHGTAGVGAGVAEDVVLHPGMVDGDVAYLLACSDIHA